MTDETPGVYVLTPGGPRRRFPWLRRYLTVGPYHVGIVIRDGRVEEVFSEGRRRLPRGEVQTYVASTAPFNLVFWLKDPGDPSEPGEGIALDQPVLTSDLQLVTGRIDLTLSVIPGNAERLLQRPRPSGVITPADVGDAIKAELLAKVLALDIHRHTAGELRGNRDLFRGIGDSLETELASTIARYGLNLDNFYVNWGLTHEERERIEEQRHQSAIREIERKKELEEARIPSEVAPPDSGPRPAETPPPPRPEPVPTPRTGRPTRGEWVSLSELDPPEPPEPQPELLRPIDRGERHRVFFQTLADRLQREGFTGPRKAGTDGEMVFTSGCASWITFYARLAATKEANVILSLESTVLERNKELFDRLLGQRESIGSELTEPLVWDRKDRHKSSHIFVVRPNSSIHADDETLSEIQDWMARNLHAFKTVFVPRLNELKRCTGGGLD